jgi:5-oxoprolinase (ATP-hydrolysing) subunit A
MTIDLNIDIGEGGTCDEALLALATSANIACGGHAGGGRVLHEALARARNAGVAIGAHPGYQDRANFGRVETREDAGVIGMEVRRQLMDFCDAFGAPPHHVKPHGALYHRMDRDSEVARIFCRVIRDVAPGAWVYAFAGGGFSKAAAALGLRVCGEGFIDRGYGADGCLIPRGQAGAALESPEEAAAQAVRLAGEGKARTLCVHGDEPRAVEVLTNARAALVAAGWCIGAPGVPCE